MYVKVSYLLSEGLNNKPICITWSYSLSDDLNRIKPTDIDFRVQSNAMGNVDVAVVKGQP